MEPHHHFGSDVLRSRIGRGWPDTALSGGASLLLTTALFVGAVGVGMTTHRVSRAERRPSVAATERMTPISLPQLPAARTEPVRPRTAPTVAPADLSSTPGTTSSATLAAGSAGGAAELTSDSATTVADHSANARPCIGPCGDRVRAALPTADRERAARRASMDSTWREFRARFIDLANRDGTASREETDAIWRARSLAASASTALNRAPVPLASASIPVGLPGGGPSAAERRRNAIVHAANLARIARIQSRIAASDTLELQGWCVPITAGGIWVEEICGATPR